MRDKRAGRWGADSRTMEAGEGEEESKRPEGGQQSNNRPTTHVAPHISDL